MNYLYESLDKPTRLYIKQCSHCELKYFGKSIREDIENYDGSGVRWNRHLEKHNAESIHLWHSDWYYDTSISRFALKFSHMNKIVESNAWANLIPENGISGGDTSNTEGFILGIEKQKITKSSEDWKLTTGKQHAQNLSKTQNDPEWKNTVGKSKRKKVSIAVKMTVNDPDWKSSIGIEKSRKQSKTLNDPVWQKTTGKAKIKKISETYNDPEWQKSKGKEKSDNIRKTKSSKEWKEIKGKIAGKKISDKINSPEWKELNYKTCPHCDAWVRPCHYSLYHGDKCKSILE